MYALSKYVSVKGLYILPDRQENVPLMRIFCVFSRHNYGDPLRGDGYDTHPACISALGHDVSFLIPGIVPPL